MNKKLLKHLFIFITTLSLFQNTYGQIRNSDDLLSISKDRYNIQEIKHAPIQVKPKRQYMGNFRISFYCNCEICCGQWSGMPCYNGEYPKAHYTIAVDPDVIPIDSFVQIEGLDFTYKAQDTGSAIKGNRIDVYCEDHQTCLDLGIMKNVKVYKVTK